MMFDRNKNELDIVFSEGLHPAKFQSDKQFQGFTYPGFMHNRVIQWAWSKVFCTKNMHLFDEVIGASDEEADVPGHYLCCDACGIVVEIGRVMTQGEVNRRIIKFYDDLIAKAKHNKKKKP